MSTKRANTELKATFTQMSISPRSSSTRPATLSRAAASAVSTVYAHAVPPSRSMSRRAPSRPRSPLASRATVSPLRANRRAVARPMPPEAPVTTTTREEAEGLLMRQTHRHFFLAAALPPLRPASFFWAVVPPCELSPPEPLFLHPRLDAPGLLAILAARSLDMPLSFNASYCFSFFTFADLLGIQGPPSTRLDQGFVPTAWRGMPDERGTRGPECRAARRGTSVHGQAKPDRGRRVRASWPRSQQTTGGGR